MAGESEKQDSSSWLWAIALVPIGRLVAGSAEQSPFVLFALVGLGVWFISRRETILGGLLRSGINVAPTAILIVLAFHGEPWSSWLVVCWVFALIWLLPGTFVKWVCVPLGMYRTAHYLSKLSPWMALPAAPTSSWYAALALLRRAPPSDRHWLLAYWGDNPRYREQPKLGDIAARLAVSADRYPFLAMYGLEAILRWPAVAKEFAKQQLDWKPALAGYGSLRRECSNVLTALYLRHHAWRPIISGADHIGTSANARQVRLAGFGAKGVALPRGLRWLPWWNHWWTSAPLRSGRFFASPAWHQHALGHMNAAKRAEAWVSTFDAVVGALYTARAPINHGGLDEHAEGLVEAAVAEISSDLRGHLGFAMAASRARLEELVNQAEAAVDQAEGDADDDSYDDGDDETHADETHGDETYEDDTHDDDDDDEASSYNADDEPTYPSEHAYGLAIHQAICDRLIDPEWSLLERQLADIAAALAGYSQSKPWPDQRIVVRLVDQWNTALGSAHRLRMLRVDAEPLGAMESLLTDSLATVWNDQADRSLGAALGLIAATFVGSDGSLDNAKIVVG